MNESILYEVLINNQDAIAVTPQDVQTLDVVALGDGHFHVIANAQSLNIHVLSHDIARKEMTLKIQNRVVDLKLSDPVELQIKAMGFERNGKSDVNEVSAPMPGKVLSIVAGPGSEVNEGDPLVILEAMKMENVLSSPRSAVVKEVHIKEGQTVDKAQVLVTFE